LSDGRRTHVPPTFPYPTPQFACVMFQNPGCLSSLIVASDQIRTLSVRLFFLAFVCILVLWLFKGPVASSRNSLGSLFSPGRAALSAALAAVAGVIHFLFFPCRIFAGNLFVFPSCVESETSGASPSGLSFGVVREAPIRRNVPFAL